MNLAVFVSGRGSNLKAILDYPGLDKLVSVVAVISDKFDCAAFSIAKEKNIATFTTGKAEGKLSEVELLNLLTDLKVDLIVLAGYLKLIPAILLEQYAQKIINIHPALLPSFGGKGMYGMNVHKAVFDSSAQVSGATVHFVDNTYDTGKIIAQKSVDISDVVAPEEIAERVLTVEHKILPEVIKAFAEGRIQIELSRVYIKKKS